MVPFFQSKHRISAQLFVLVLEMLGTLWCAQSKFGWSCWQTLKKRFCGFFRWQNVNPVSGSWLSVDQSKGPQILRNSWLHCVAFAVDAVPQQSGTFLKRSGPLRLVLSVKRHSNKHTCTRTQACTNTQILFLDSMGWTDYHLRGCNSRHTSLWNPDAK